MAKGICSVCGIECCTCAGCILVGGKCPNCR